MTARIIDGRARAAQLRTDIKTAVSAMQQDGLGVPGLAVVLIGADPASEVYVRSKLRATQEAGIESFSHHFDDTVTQAELLAFVHKLNADPSVHGILVQLPLPAHIDKLAIINAISPDKDVDGFHLENVGRLATGQSSFVPCTPLGCLTLLREELGDLRGMVATVVGCSNIVGHPMAELLLKDDCTVLIAHKFTRDTAALVRQADIVVAAAGVPGLIKGDWIKPGACVIDVGINRVPAPEKGLNADGTPKTKLVGDVDFDAAVTVANAITPVPGGVGPMTIACLLLNTVTAFCTQVGREQPANLAA
ncbi:bifunctional methylenetetrahydrofolate dehydrogenase/methenyltetrahydrofolate cyclohydrolase FolD [Loktanella sp. D2R18]|uniref:bifunctional methylenetetrahydrofolate dehydrogenase/methenyltetrahydrofolate cyclohydrolase FolD n=1 Tax=Rhodobacterales TaxID=204455 RepID=UPI000DE8C153|nr:MULTISPECIES: bifunctional methylenetetrahydrofolate dehydrogenase/methenyltetrahydrofolate cyclohydrolase FolD [Rhodobacterales]MDO6592136.1 bifunctional methylenetetrahydrofolate dehydrogenase/methenyltetrahydrofolate cyclohydrolase FolD [Yoonia sp. 1_MG-2023]RBW42717.1 bifunctional methylenetetrahydrofolate dehydrogenase/methenyltetrahydrofolate cyclohydrolase FolD [Loktanella sp. D2R18]